MQTTLRSERDSLAILPRFVSNLTNLARCRSRGWTRKIINKIEHLSNLSNLSNVWTHACAREETVHRGQRCDPCVLGRFVPISLGFRLDRLDRFDLLRAGGHLFMSYLLKKVGQVGQVPVFKAPSKAEAVRHA
jgi:hypothetical protein